MFFHTIHCSIAAHLGGSEVANSLRDFFEYQKFDDEQVIEAIVRLCLTKAWSNGVLFEHTELEVRQLIETQVRQRNPKALLSDYLRNGDRPWLDLIKAFANFLQNSIRDFEELIDDSSIRDYEQTAIDFARNWRPRV